LFKVQYLSVGYSGLLLSFQFEKAHDYVYAIGAEIFKYNYSSKGSCEILSALCNRRFVSVNVSQFVLLFKNYLAN